MADEMYIRRDGAGTSPKRLRWLAALIVGGLLAGGVFWWRASRVPAGPVTDSAPETTSLPAPRPAAPSAAPATNGAPNASAPAAAATDDPGWPAFSAARAAQERGDLTAARAQGFLALEQVRHPTLKAAVETLLGQINTDLLLQPFPMEEKTDYVIQAGDRIATLARQHHTTVELIQRSNNIKGHVIRVGDRIRVPNGTFSIRVSKGEHALYLMLNGRFFKKYRVGVGKYEKTPVGEFQITDRISQPTWWRPDGKEIKYGDPENLLGTHWLALNVKGYGIHGTWEPDSIGKSESAGCIRMLNSEVEELFMLVPVGTAVTITE